MKRSVSFAAVLLSMLISCSESGSKVNNEQSSSESQSVDSTFTGERDSKWPNGKLKSLMNYVNGKREGLGKSYYKTGSIQLEIEYRNGVKHGLEKYFYEDGKLYRETTYVNGARDGEQTFYHKNGKTMGEVMYKEDKLCIGTKEYNDQGKLFKLLKLESKTRDEVVLSGKYTITLRLSKSMRKVKYYELYDTENLPCPKYMTERPSRNGVLTSVLEYQPGDIEMKDIYYLVECESYQRVPHLVLEKVRVSVTYRN